jgi:hypothetical protein
MIKNLLKNPLLRRSADVLLSPFTFLAALWYKYIRSGHGANMPISEKIFMKTGLLPVNDHYYQPLINPLKYLTQPLNQDRKLPGLNLNTDEQVELLNRLDYSDELNEIDFDERGNFRFFYNNPSFRAGDAQYYYNLLRLYKPAKIIEIGCGYSTLLAMEAARMNKVENAPYSCRHICIEPYEMPWLEKLNVEVHRHKVEETDLSFFSQLKRNDILFIDSSHMIRPQGDVLYEYLQILPILNSGTLIHVHDIFTPKDYPKEWIIDQHCFWNEQYLLEAFLSLNKDFRIIGALNYLKHHHRAIFDKKFPASAKMKDDEPGSFWMVKN